MAGKFELYKDKSGKFRFRLKGRQRGKSSPPERLTSQRPARRRALSRWRRTPSTRRWRTWPD